MTFEKIKLLCESILPITTVVGIAIIGFLLLMAFTRKFGKDTWLGKKSHLLTKNGKIVRQFPQSTTNEFFWKDPVLINSGLSSFAGVCILSLYVLVMYFYISPSPDKGIEVLNILFTYPNIMMSFMTILSIVVQKITKHCIPSIIITCLCAVLSIILMILPFSAETKLLFQLFILLVQALTFSYTEGIRDAFKHTDIKARYPLVEITTTSGEKINGLRFCNNNPSDYCFINEEANEVLYPRGNIFHITILDE